MAKSSYAKSWSFSLSKRQKFIIFHIFDSTCLIFVQLLQGAVLNYYIQHYFKDNSFSFALHSMDIVCSLVFAFTLYTSYHYLLYFVEHDQYPDKNFSVSPKRILTTFPTSKLGVLPLGYMSWIIYVAVLLFKISVIFGADLFILLNESGNVFGPQLLKMIIGLSSLVFLLLVEAHNRLEPNTERYTYATMVCSKVGIEIFDSVSLLSVLLLGDQIPRSFEQTVCILAGLNFILPALSLYKLSLPDTLMTEFSRKYPLQLLHHLLRTFFIELPFLSVRLYLWINFKEEASMFMMKNIFNILVTLRTIHPEIVEYFNRDDEQSTATANGQARGIALEAVALNSNNVNV